MSRVPPMKCIPHGVPECPECKAKPRGAVSERFMRYHYGASTADHSGQVVIPAGTLIHFNGLPFELTRDTAAHGTPENLALAQGASGSDAKTRNSDDKTARPTYLGDFESGGVIAPGEK